MCAHGAHTLDSRWHISRNALDRRLEIRDAVHYIVNAWLKGLTLSEIAGFLH